MVNIQGLVNDRMLTNYTRLLGPSLGSFMADGICPSVDVSTKTGNFYSVGGGFASASPGHDLIIADGQDSPLQISTSVSKVTGWDVNVNGLGVKMNKSSAEYAQGNGLDLRKANAAVLARQCMIHRERTAAALIFNATTFSGYTAALSGSDQWDNAASDPISKAQDARDAIITNSGETPNVAILGYEVYSALRQHPLLAEFSSRTKHTTGILTNEDLAQALDVDTIWVGKAVANSAYEGQTESNAFIWGKFVLFAHIKSSPAAMTPQSCLQRFRMAGSTDGAIRRWEPTPYVEQLDALWNDQFAVPTPALGYLYQTAVS
ncbi:hypothetical protein CMI37_07050 [Candidatus Pacearchaeota archaeon]|nr:hypothetical protein [Candidatus Pacearchaeota archaeon]|tara:strand:+ start:797 stop:1753 length:957 start_codon:yes stop_codon:yes gene_type:complete